MHVNPKTRTIFAGTHSTCGIGCLGVTVLAQQQEAITRGSDAHDVTIKATARSRGDLGWSIHVYSAWIN